MLHHNLKYKITFATAPFFIAYLLSRQQYRQHSLLDVQTVLSLGEDLVGVGLEDGSRDLLAAVSGQAVEHHAVRLCGFQEAAGELEACKVPQAALALGGAGGSGIPDSRHHHIGVLDAFGGVFQQAERTAVLMGEHQHICRRAVTVGADAVYLHAGEQTAHDEAVGHIAAVADEAELLAHQRTPALPDGHEVGQHLTGVSIVRQAIDDGDARKLSELFQIALAVGAPDNAVIIAAQHPGGILERLAAAGLQLGGGIHVVAEAAQLVDAHLEAGAGTGGIFREHQRDALALEQRFGASGLLLSFQLIGHIKDVGHLVRG